MSSRRGRYTGSSKVQVSYGVGVGRRAQQVTRGVRDVAKARQAALKKFKERVAGMCIVLFFCFPSHYVCDRSRLRRTGGGVEHGRRLNRLGR